MPEVLLIAYYLFRFLGINNGSAHFYVGPTLPKVAPAIGLYEKCQIRLAY